MYQITTNLTAALKQFFFLFVITHNKKILRIRFILTKLFQQQQKTILIIYVSNFLLFCDAVSWGYINILRYKRDVLFFAISKFRGWNQGLPYGCKWLSMMSKRASSWLHSNRWILQVNKRSGQMEDKLKIKRLQINHVFCITSRQAIFINTW